jgi:RNA polymerase sigma factor (sigma-70 family)
MPLPGRAGAFGPRDHLTDGQLLERFVRLRDESAFAALVRRHGPMVLGVCQRVLGHAQDAEDAFQATFLVLVRKASSLEKPELLANFLYGVAYRTALNARSRAARRGRHEREAASMCSAASDPESFGQEVHELLDEELHRLPEKYRTPLILCYLEGKTNEEAAQLLGWPLGSMSFRLARGRELLRDRLNGRMQALSVALPAALLLDRLEPTSVPPVLADATVQAALGLLGVKALGVGCISASVNELMEATLRGLKPRGWYRNVLLAILLLLGLSAAAYGASGGWFPSDEPSTRPSTSSVRSGAGGCKCHRTN